MTRSIVIAAFVAFFGSSAFAQSFDPTIGTGNIRPYRYVTQKAPGKYVNRPDYNANAKASPKRGFADRSRCVGGGHAAL